MTIMLTILIMKYILSNGIILYNNNSNNINNDVINTNNDILIMTY